MDHNLTVHGVWLHAARTGYGIWVERVPTKDNIADLPSRESYGLLQAMGARWVEPVMDDAFLEPTKWEHVALVNSGPRLSGCINIYEYAYTCIYEYMYIPDIIISMFLSFRKYEIVECCLSATSINIYVVWPHKVSND